MMQDLNSNASSRRIFWLGMHKVLSTTEYVYLQELGYEVFRPPYLSNVQDQSAATEWDSGNTTLSSSVIKKLSEYNFFYNEITEEIADILNCHFGTVLVTINPDWLKSVLTVYSGRVVYRCYGQPGNVSASLRHNGCDEMIRQRSDFFYMPHCNECLDDEESWLRAFATVVPYWLTEDVILLRDTWKLSPHTPTVGLSCPNIANSYYQRHFRYLKSFFEERCFRYYGVQLDNNSDPNVVGTLPRPAQLASFCRDSGYLYTYHERNVCYLPPIEMMVLGGPVIFMPGSLLSRYADPESPGLAQNEYEAIKKSRALMRGDKVFIGEVISYQQNTLYRYTPQYGKPIFKEAFRKILPIPRSNFDAPSSTILSPSKQAPVLIFAHLGGYTFANGQYSCIHGIPRVLRQLVRALTNTGIPVVVTSDPISAELIHGFFSNGCKNSHLVSAFIYEMPDFDASSFSCGEFSYAIVPHYHLFPEANLLEIPLLAYIPDYMPHYFYGRDYFTETEDVLRCGCELASKAKLILTNSAFSAKYLPACKLQVPASNIRHFPLPFLGTGVRRTSAGWAANPKLVETIADRRFIFYPTQPHPHKRLDLLILAWIMLNQRGFCGEVVLVLTAGEISPKLRNLIDSEGLSSSLVLAPALDDFTLEWLFGHAGCLAFSSELEGNFPTQILEAIFLDCPIACMDNPLIMAELLDLACFFQITPFGDVNSFSHSIERAINHRSYVLSQQALAKPILEEYFSFHKFSENVVALNEEMLLSP